MRRDETWNTFLESLWRFQYTQKGCRLTPQLNRTLYDVSQGITDLAVKAYMLAQARAITRGDETITPGLIRSVAHDSFRMARPILDALKSGNIQELYKVDDVLPVDIETLLRAITKSAQRPSPIQAKGTPGKDAPTPNKQETTSGQETLSTTPPAQEATGVLPEQTEMKGADSLAALAVQGRELGVPVYDLMRKTGCLATDDKQPIKGGKR